MAVLSSTRSGTDGPNIPSCSRLELRTKPCRHVSGAACEPRSEDRTRTAGRVIEADVHAGPRPLRSTLTVLPSRTSRSFPSRASQPIPRRRSWSGSLVPCLNLLSVVTPCSSRYCQIAPAASPISASIVQLSLSLPHLLQPEPHSRSVTNPPRSRQARWRLRLLPSEHFALASFEEIFPARRVVFLRVVTGAHSGAPQLCPNSSISASACSSQNRMSISRYIVVAVVRCCWASCSLPMRR